jgi:aryl-alcohol dehydrogenase-like predicted oxidoreductase
MMNYRTLGKTGWRISEIGLGTMPLSGMYGPVDDAAAVKTMLYAFEKGINFVDTALMYGSGRAHLQIAQALKQWDGEKIYVATKAEPLRWPDPYDSNPTMRGRYPDWYLRAEVERSLKQLEVERIDLFQLHCWMPQGITQLDWLETLNDLRLEGKIDKIGVSIRDHRPEDGVDLARLGLVDSQQVVFNLFDQRPADTLFRAGQETNTGFIVRVPFDSGSLIGNWTPDTYKSFPKGSIKDTYFAGWRFKETFERVQKLEELIKPYYSSLAEAALRYCLSESAVTTVIPGIATPQEIDLNLTYSDGQAFPEELKVALKPHGWPRNFYALDRTDDDATPAT